MRKTEDAIQSHRQSAQVATSLDYDANDVEQSQEMDMQIYYLI